MESGLDQVLRFRHFRNSSFRMLFSGAGARSDALEAIKNNRGRAWATASGGCLLSVEAAREGGKVTQGDGCGAVHNRRRWRALGTAFDWLRDFGRSYVLAKSHHDIIIGRAYWSPPGPAPPAATSVGAKSVSAGSAQGGSLWLDDRPPAQPSLERRGSIPRCSHSRQSAIET